MSAIATAQFVVSLATTKLHLNITATSSDSWLDKTISSITKKVETYCNRRIASATFTEFHDGDGHTGFFYVDNPEILAVSTLHEDVNRDFDSSSQFATSTFITYAEEGRVEILNAADIITTDLQSVVFPRGQQNIRIVYTGGFTIIPEDIRYGTLEWIAKLFKRRDRKRWGIKSDTKGDVVTSYEMLGVMPKEAQEFLQPYRLRKMGALGRRRF